jgi:hypothetical protein
VTLRDAIKLYLSRRRSEGRAFVSAERILMAFAKMCGDLDAGELTAQHVFAFVTAPHRKAVTSESTFNTIRCFVEYWGARGQIAPLALQRPPKPTPPPQSLAWRRRQHYSTLLPGGRHASHVSASSLRNRLQRRRAP